MSDFLCGEIVLGDTISPDDAELWFAIAEAAIASRLNIQFGVNIIQKVALNRGLNRGRTPISMWRTAWSKSWPSWQKRRRNHG